MTPRALLILILHALVVNSTETLTYSTQDLALPSSGDNLERYATLDARDDLGCPEGAIICHAFGGDVCFNKAAGETCCQDGSGESPLFSHTLLRPFQS